MVALPAGGVAASSRLVRVPARRTEDTLMGGLIVFTPDGALNISAWRLKRFVCLTRRHERPLIEWYNGDGWARVCPRCGASL